MSAENFKEPAQVAFDNGHAIFNASKTRLIKKYADQYGDGWGEDCDPELHVIQSNFLHAASWPLCAL